ncbi:hypothetical protein Daus18300_014017 [Diaporthe australafricana]|uniref:Uncharacterized protein n=1 Tax=Diaporthe australafricana TaxID=127596 RepID=A0ABR3VWV1_9PEZI
MDPQQAVPSDECAQENPPQKIKKKERPAAEAQRGRAEAQDNDSRRRDAGTDTRSVSRGRTHNRSRQEFHRGQSSSSPESFVYPNQTGGFAPKGRAPTMFEEKYLSDAPHLEYRPIEQRRRRGSGKVKSPDVSCVEVEAGIKEVEEARGGPEEAQKQTKEESTKREGR